MSHGKPFKRQGSGSEAAKRWRTVPTGRCTAHGKLLYKNAKQAKRAIAAMREKGAMDVYPCGEVVGVHVGHHNRAPGEERR